MTKDVALEVAKNKIRVNSVHPGLILTTKGEEVTDHLGIPIDEFVKNIPISRVGIPEGIANRVLYLASDESTFITAQEMVVDGGHIH